MLRHGDVAIRGLAHRSILVMRLHAGIKFDFVIDLVKLFLDLGPNISLTLISQKDTLGLHHLVFMNKILD